MADHSPIDLDAVVIGAGLSGIYMLHRLRDQLGLSATVCEASDGIGGTWHLNRYPGARCDTESFIYCYSFSRELCQEWRWSGKYPTQAEIHRYLNHVVDRFDLRRDIRLNTRVVGARYGEDGRWYLTTACGGQLTARFLVTAVGLLASAPHVPYLPGLETFQGRWCHTGDWPRDGIELAGKRVGVIGTGSTGVQTIPVIARSAGHLTVFQRTPQFAIPAQHHTIGPDELRDIRRRYDEVWQRAQWSSGGFPYTNQGRSALSDTPARRRAVFEELWAQGGLRFMISSYNDLLFDRRANDFVAEFIREKIRERVRDPRTREMLVPRDYPFGAKRPVVETNYYETYNQDNVELVDIHTCPIVEVTSTGIRTEAGHHELDVIVFATGFDAVTGPLLRLNITGRDGLRLADHWAHGPCSYLGLAVTGFPNMFMITGPGSIFGNIAVIAEHHVDWIADMIGHLLAGDQRWAEACREAEDDWTGLVARVASKSVIPLADSWSMGSNVPGKPRTALFYLGSYSAYRKQCDDVAANGYAGFTLGREAMPAARKRR